MNPYHDKLKVTRITPGEFGNVKAFVSVQLGQALVIHGVKIIQQTGQRAYVRLPDQKRGEKWFPVIEAVDDRFLEAVQSVVLTAWEKALHGRKNHLEMRGGRL